MGNEEKKKASEQMGTLGGCLIEGDSEQKARERKARRRALTISIGLQSAALVALVVTPLLAKPEKLAFTLYTPIPQYYHQRVQPVGERAVRPQPQRNTTLYQPSSVPPRIVTRDPGQTNAPTGSDAPDPNAFVPVPGVPGGTEFTSTQPGPKPPGETTEQKKRITVGGAIQQAMLVRRVEPCFPPLARQLRRGGQVHLHAVISTDGTIESLQLMDGDPLFVQCAMDAVRQWRYRPTLLNGSPVEVETVITVIYTLNQ